MTTDQRGPDPAVVLALAAELGYPAIVLHPMLERVAGGAESWRVFAETAPGATLAVALRRLRAIQEGKA